MLPKYTVRRPYVRAYKKISYTREYAYCFLPVMSPVQPSATQEARTLLGRVHYDISAIGRQIWDSCTTCMVYNPFVDYRFLYALEKSASACADTGWGPFHIALESEGETVALMPLYLKSHSRGEYVFDGSWANALHQAGGRYYPKLQSSVPFTPATGPRLLAKPGQYQREYQRQLLLVSAELAKKTNVSSLHITFMQEDEWQLAGSCGLLQRVDTQFHWYNNDYPDFDHFQADLASKKRKNIRRERRDALKTGIEIEWVSGPDLKEHHWDAFYAFYTDTTYRKWGSIYLTRDFFSLISEAMPESVLLILAKRHGKYVAGAINFIGGDTLFGRNWGCTEHHPFLHFEICYYQAIEYAIAHKLRCVEAGAQGSHKIARGYLAHATHSAHWFADANFNEAVADFLQREQRYVKSDIAYVQAHSPFKTILENS